MEPWPHGWSFKLGAMGNGRMSAGLGIWVGDRWNARGNAGEHRFQAGDEGAQGDAEGGADDAQFQDVQAAFACLVFAGEGLRFAQPDSQIRLPQARLFADGAQTG